MRLLFVDDSKPLCRLYLHLAQEVAGVEPTALENPLEALAWAQEHVPDVVVVDYLMPEMDGLQFLGKLAVIAEAWPVKPSTLMITAVDEMDVRLSALKLGVLDFIAKPLQGLEFVSRLRNLAVAHRNLVYLKERDQEFAELQIVQENAMEGIARLDANDCFTWVNRVFALIVGLPSSRLIGVNINDAFALVERNDFTVSYQLMRRAGLGEITVKLPSPSGGTTVAELSLVALPLRDGEYAGHMIFARDVSAEHQASELMRQSQERLRYALEATQDGLWDWDIVGGKMYCNDRWLEMLGYARDEFEVTVERWESLCHPDDLPAVQRGMVFHMAGLEPVYEIEHRLRHKNGDWVWVLVRGRVVQRNELTEPLRMVGTNVDITARRAQEAKLKQSEERWQFAIEGSGDGIWDWDIARGSVYFSERWKSMLGYAPEDIRDDFSEWERLLHPEDLVAAKTFIERYFAGEVPEYVNEFRMLCKNGEYHWVLARGMVTSRDEHGKPLRMIGTHHDIHERRLVEQAVQDSEARFRDMAENFPGVIFQIHPSAAAAQTPFSFGYVSPRIKSLFDIPGDALMAEPALFYDRIHPDDVSRHHQSLLTAFAERRPWSFQGRYLHPDGRQIWFESEARPSGNIEVPAFNGVLLDISLRKQLERVKDEFVSTVSHELRTPLTSIIGSLKLINALAASALPVKVTELLSLAQRNADRLLSLINDLLDMAKIESGAMSIDASQFSATNLLKDAVAMNQGYATKLSVTLTSSAPDDCPLVWGDAARTIQVLSNLISNACKFSPAGATVTAGVQIADGYARFSVLDNGPGIPDDFKQQIFQKFSQADSSDTRKIGGTGLGLSICKALVERMGGKIGFDSTPQVETTFWFTLPLAPSA